jgi:lipoate-protein ligase A
MTKLRVLFSDTFDPWFNLAIEEWIFRDMDSDYQILYLWRNDQTVVIGRFQNPWTECHTEKMEQDGIKLARRQSGGGAVFHDLGNTNFTFLSSKDSYDKNKNNKMIIDALKNFGIEAFASGRNDILVSTNDGDKKISGSAFKETKDRSFHHGTLLIKTDMTRLSNYLSPHPKKLNSKGIQSVRARVINLSELNDKINHESICNEIVKQFFKTYGKECEVEFLKHEDLKNIEKLNNHYEKLKDWNWRFGEAPSFTHSMSEYFAWGLIEVHLDVEKAQIKKCKIYSDSLHPEFIELLMASFDHISYNKESFQKTLSALKLNYPMFSEYLAEFEEWIIKEIN